MLAKDGRSKPFSADADGYGRGEGCGAVVLKRLDDAMADGDKVLAVIKVGLSFVLVVVVDLPFKLNQATHMMALPLAPYMWLALLLPYFPRLRSLRSISLDVLKPLLGIFASAFVPGVHY